MSTPYYDTNATTPIEPRVAEVIMHYLTVEYGNAGSRTHAYGSRAAKAVESARTEIEEILGIENGRVVFTSGATESNNLAILGLASSAKKTGRNHIVTTAIEHKAVLEPVHKLVDMGFEVDIVSPNSSGAVAVDDIMAAVRKDTLLVSVMHVNNETGVIQPIEEVGANLAGSETLFHVDAAQGFGKDIDRLKSSHADLISVSAHKIYGPKGVGALSINYKSGKPIELEPLMVGGGQEGGLRPGTLPVHLIAGLGKAAELARTEHASRHSRNVEIFELVQSAIQRAGGIVNGASDRNVGNVINVSFPGVDSESAILMTQEDLAISNGAACSSSSYEYSHVLKAMRLDDSLINSALRISWYHDSPSVDWDHVFSTIGALA